MRYVLCFFAFTFFAFAGTCSNPDILGVFPKIANMKCTDYALFIGFVGIISAYIFWENVTK